MVEVYPLLVAHARLYIPKKAREPRDVVFIFFACNGGYRRWVETLGRTDGEM